jgi:hypothetical protein
MAAGRGVELMSDLVRIEGFPTRKSGAPRLQARTSPLTSADADQKQIDDSARGDRMNLVSSV